MGTTKDKKDAMEISERVEWESGSRQKRMGLVYWFSWAIFIVYEKVTLRLPWPIKRFVLGQFPGEFRAQQQVLRAGETWSFREND